MAKLWTNLPCVNTIELNKYLAQQDRDIAEAEYRDSKRQDLETEYKQKLDFILRMEPENFEPMANTELQSSVVAKVLTSLSSSTTFTATLKSVGANVLTLI